MSASGKLVPGELADTHEDALREAVDVVLVRRGHDGIRRERRFRGMVSRAELLDTLRDIVREDD